MRIHIKWLALGALVNLLIFLSPLFIPKYTTVL